MILDQYLWILHKKQGANKKLSFIFWVKWKRPEIYDYICLQERLTLV